MGNSQGLILVNPPEAQPTSWAPQQGVFCDIYKNGLEGLTPGSIERVFLESSQILGNSTAPWTQKYSETGLVVGYVQSGKTLSFTTIAALARDNGYGLVVVIAGVTNLLKEQSTDRLIDDLGLKKYPREWRIFENPGAKHITNGNLDLRNLRESIQGWMRFHDHVGPKKPTILITVLKKTERLNNLANLLRALDLSAVPTLIVDDESDQATPNTQAAQNLSKGSSAESSTYAAVQDLRIAFSRHTYLQYTATPQANLLAAKVDQLAPRFARVIQAGEGYTGGEFFFGNPKSKNLELIPDDQIYKKGDLPDEVPETLLEALRLFWLGAAHTLLTGDEMSVRSMMIQASQLTDPHRQYAKWAQDCQTNWARVLRSGATQSHQQLQVEFGESFENLKATVNTGFLLGDYLAMLPDVIEETNIVLVNSTEDAVNKVEWYQAQFWILVGGNKLDRGFTVRGIISTYMPRSASDNGDVLQQRARFFGYHGAYSGLVRVFLGKETRAAFESYLLHETHLRASLLAHQGKPLSEWRRNFILNQAITRPVRQSVVGRRLVKERLSDSWLAPKFMHLDMAAVRENLAWLKKIADAFRANYPEHRAAEVAAWKDSREQNQHTWFSSVPAAQVQEVLLGFRFAEPADEARMISLNLAIAMKLKTEPLLNFNVVFMNDLRTDGQTGRNVDPEKGLTNIFTGRNPVNAKNISELNYVGDSAIKSDDVPTLHLRVIRVKQRGGEDGLGVTSLDVAWLAVHLTSKLENTFYQEIGA